MKSPWFSCLVKFLSCGMGHTFTSQLILNYPLLYNNQKPFVIKGCGYIYYVFSKSVSVHNYWKFHTVNKTVRCCGDWRSCLLVQWWTWKKERTLHGDPKLEWSQKRPSWWDYKFRYSFLAWESQSTLQSKTRCSVSPQTAAPDTYINLCSSLFLHFFHSRVLVPDSCSIIPALSSAYKHWVTQ
jgi:hypothetical protein